MTSYALKNSDLYSYATIQIQSHGFMVRTNEEFMYEIDIDSICGMTLRVHAGPMNPKNPMIKPEDVDRMIWDERSKGGNSFIMVYRSGKTKEEVLKLLHPQLKDHLAKRKAMYELLAKNAQSMLDVLDSNIIDQHIC